MSDLLSTAKLLYANCIGCIVQHHGHKTTDPLPGWLADAEKDIFAASAVLGQSTSNLTEKQFAEYVERSEADLQHFRAENDRLRAKYEELDRVSERELAATETERDELWADSNRLREALKTAEYKTQRYKDALDKNASFEKLWEEVSNEIDRLREALTLIPKMIDHAIEHYRGNVVGKMRRELTLHVRAALAKEAGQ